MPADAVFRVGRAYRMTADRGVYQAVAVTDGRIAAGGPVDDLPSRQPALTLVGGRPVHDPDGLLGAA